MPQINAPSQTRRKKRDKNDDWLKKKNIILSLVPHTKTRKKKVNKQSATLKKHGKDGPSGGFEAMFPSLIGVGVLVCAVMAQQGFRGRASVAGIDLGTTNSVICVQALSKGVGKIDCIPDPDSGSPIIVGLILLVTVLKYFFRLPLAFFRHLLLTAFFVFRPKYCSHLSFPF